ncbi:ubiquinone anaerobic biosynthesis protein UbiU [Martelella soudanensis]|uniref:ubiquinone anaerobic biosynthesis protein UbiU n=1 Tax=unclassified Martelella TaxID=2629616 RepID=UPI0015DFC075|nr:MULTISPECIES: peptidase U32 family protein [unclassified Martelella]
MGEGNKLELVCPAGTPAALRTAVDAGADSIYCGFHDETDARNFPGLNFLPEELAQGVAYAHAKGARVLVVINTFPRAGAAEIWHRAVDEAAGAGADAMILNDIGLIAYAAERYPGLRRHFSVQATKNADTIRFYVEEFYVKRVVLPRVLTVAEIAAINREAPCETEVFVVGGLCVMAEGCCSLSSYATGRSPNMNGVCSPTSHVHHREEGGELVSRLGVFTIIDRVSKHEPASYPTLCKSCFSVGGKRGHVFEDPVSLDAATLIPELARACVTALKIEGRQRSRSYIRDVVASFRRAVDAQAADNSIPVGELRRLSEGQTTTADAYRRTWC